MTLRPAGRGLLASVLLAAGAGCGQNDVQVYRVAKESPEVAATQSAPVAMAAAGQPAAGDPSPELQWKTPAGWEEVPPGEMRVASFRVPGKGGKTADVSVIPLPGMAGGDLGNVNRWRGQVGLAPVTADELPKLAQKVEIAGQAGQLYDQAGSNPSSGDKTRILAAITRHADTAWFFKMTGDDELVAQQKPAFIGFLKSLKFNAAALPELPPSHPPIGGTMPGVSELPPSHPPIGGGAMPGVPALVAGPKPNWQVPAGWQEIAGGQFLVAKFAVGGKDNAQAFVNVSMSAGMGGGLLANVNRWRGQLGLAPLTETDLAAQTRTLALPNGSATVVEMSGTDARSGQPTRLLGAIVPHGSDTWFYKLMGPEQLVQGQKDAFDKFVQSVKYAD